MKILYATSNVSIPGRSGDTTHVQELCNSFSKKNKVYSITYKKKGQKFVEKFNDNLIMYRILNIPLIKPLALFIQTFFLSIYLIIFKRIDVVDERGKLFGGAAILASAIFRKPRVYELNEPIVESLVLEKRMKKNGILYKFANFWMNWNIKLSHKVTVTHENVLKNKKSVLVHYGANIKKFKPKVNGSDKIKKKFNLEGVAFYYIGSFAPWHNIDHIVRAGAKIAKKYPKTKFLLIGKQHKKGEDIAKLVEKLNVSENFILIDNILYKDVPKWNAAVDVCLAIFDNNYEPFRKFGFYYSPIKIHEYLASGKPVIASDMGNLARIIKNNHNGILVKPNDIKSLERAMELFISNKAKLRQMSKNARTSAEKIYNWDKHADDIIEIFENLAN